MIRNAIETVRDNAILRYSLILGTLGFCPIALLSMLKASLVAAN